MKRVTIIMLFFSLFFLPAVYGQESKGLSLETAPASLKKEFREKTGYEWEESSYQTREQFYGNWLNKKKKQLKQKLDQTEQTTNYSHADSATGQNPADAQTFQQVDPSLAVKYGSDLTSVSFSILYLYKKEFHDSWQNASLKERAKFLQSYERRKEQRRALELKKQQEEMLREQQRMQEKLQKKQEALQKQQLRAIREQEKRVREEERQQRFKQRVQENQARAKEMKNSGW